MSLLSSLKLFPEEFRRVLFSEDANSPMDWKETPNAHIYKFDLPGLSRDDVTIELHEGRVLKLFGASHGDDQETDAVKGGKWHLRERLIHSTDSVGFARQFRLPENVRADEIKASMADGVLVVTVPKDREEEPKKKGEIGNGGRRRTVEIEGGGCEGGGTHGRNKGLGRFVCCKA
uniref:ACD-ScHsp26-like protein n=1 Tax=Tamarix hispida TaxID=189793 RepID=K4NS35_9CARY|nr:ACD-ScHsp26-like protein [Tamarix hispida]